MKLGLNDRIVEIMDGQQWKFVSNIGSLLPYMVITASNGSSVYITVGRQKSHEQSELK